jgi:hypothetical protein
MSMLNQGVFILAALALVPATGCTKPESAPAKTTSEPAGNSSEPAAPAPLPDAQASAVDAAPVRTETLRFVPSSLSKTDVEGIGKYCLDCNVQKARYEYCHFDLVQLTEVVGADNLDTEVTLSVAMTPTKSETYKPKDPNMPQPEGGFTHLMFSCRALSVVPAP